jgi:hypothetical protein
MRKIISIALLVLILVALPATVLAGETAMQRTINAGWHCDDIAGAMHCFDPGDARSKNAATMNVKVYDYDGHFEGTEQLWNSDLYRGQPCPQSEIINLGPWQACHHYSH